jgi:ABC-type cobalamin/Fe3+-siderophores transport system ATPase subunit
MDGVEEEGVLLPGTVTLDPRIESVEAGGSTIPILISGVTCIVGGNNVGKSQMLRDIVSLLENQNRRQVIVNALTIRKAEATIESVQAWLRTNASRNQSAEIQYQPAVGGGSNLTDIQFLSQYNQAPNFLGVTRSFFCWLADATSRAGLGGGSLGNAGGMQPNPHPLAHLFRDGDMEERISALSNEVFDLPLTLDRVSGNVTLRVGQVELPVPPINHPTLTYADAVAELPTLESQGDGVKSFIGLALYLLTGKQKIVLIDEPEAFLHQSQAKTLGRWLAREAVEQDRQVILATHDRNIVLGLLAGDAPVSVFRLTRKGNDSGLHVLSQDQLTDVWSDPVLRYSNVLDGLFYNYVVICEADADCRFYAAVLDDLAQEGEITIKPDDVLFVPSGGKGRIPNIGQALSALGVQTFAVADFDVLKDKSKVRQIVESLGADWTTEMNTAYTNMAGAMNANNGVRWDSAKEQGVSAVPQGTANQNACELLDGLQRRGVMIVRVGEMEGFDRTITPKSTGWVSEMLSKDGHKTCTGARTLISDMFAGTARATPTAN